MIPFDQRQLRKWPAGYHLMHQKYRRSVWRPRVSSLKPRAADKLGRRVRIAYHHRNMREVVADLAIGARQALMASWDRSGARQAPEISEADQPDSVARPARRHMVRRQG